MSERTEYGLGLHRWRETTGSGTTVGDLTGQVA